jgi:Mrp family chromosome partitioning ATPase
MDAHANTVTPGAGLLFSNGDPTEPVQAPYVDEAALRLFYGNPLIGGEPGGGKSVPLIGGKPGEGKSALFNLLAAYAALSADGPASAVAGGKDGGDGGDGDADPGR